MKARIPPPNHSLHSAHSKNQKSKGFEIVNYILVLKHFFSVNISSKLDQSLHFKEIHVEKLSYVHKTKIWQWYWQPACKTLLPKLIFSIRNPILDFQVPRHMMLLLELILIVTKIKWICHCCPGVYILKMSHLLNLQVVFWIVHLHPF